jgi:hypothetical protein
MDDMPRSRFRNLSKMLIDRGLPGAGLRRFAGGAAELGCFDLNSVDSAKTSSGQTLGNADPLKHARLSWSTRTLRNNRAGEGLASG